MSGTCSAEVLRKSAGLTAVPYVAQCVLCEATEPSTAAGYRQDAHECSVPREALHVPQGVRQQRQEERQEEEGRQEEEEAVAPPLPSCGHVVHIKYLIYSSRRYSNYVTTLCLRNYQTAFRANPTRQPQLRFSWLPCGTLQHVKRCVYSRRWCDQHGCHRCHWRWRRGRCGLSGGDCWVGSHCSAAAEVSYEVRDWHAQESCILRALLT